MRHARFLLTLVLFALTLLACVSAPTTSPSTSGRASHPPLPAKDDAEVQTIREILDDPSGFAGKGVVLRGEFRGWKASCPLSAMVKRSDWILEDGTGCLYVTGLAPEGVSPWAPHGEALLVVGTVTTTRTGKPVLEADRIRVMFR